MLYNLAVNIYNISSAPLWKIKTIESKRRSLQVGYPETFSNLYSKGARKIFHFCVLFEMTIRYIYIYISQAVWEKHFYILFSVMSCKYYIGLINDSYSNQLTALAHWSQDVRRKRLDWHPELREVDKTWCPSCRPGLMVPDAALVIFHPDTLHRKKNKHLPGPMFTFLPTVRKSTVQTAKQSTLCTADILKCQSGENTWGIYYINDACIPFRWARSRTLVLCRLTHRHDFKGHLMDGAIINVIGHTCAFYCFRLVRCLLRKGVCCLMSSVCVFPFISFLGTFPMNATKNLLANTNNWK